jgi:hypothetical protein
MKWKKKSSTINEMTIYFIMVEQSGISSVAKEQRGFQLFSQRVKRRQNELTTTLLKKHCSSAILIFAPHCSEASRVFQGQG